MSLDQSIALANLFVQAIVGLAIIATLWVAFGQLRAMRAASNGQNTLAIIQFLQADEVRKARTTVRGVLRSKPHHEWTEEQRRHADLVCANYDVVGVLLFQEKLAPADVILRNWGPSIRDCYEILHPHVAEMQKSGNSGPQYWDDFAVLYQRVLDLRTH